MNSSVTLRAYCDLRVKRIKKKNFFFKKIKKKDKKIKESIIVKKV